MVFFLKAETRPAEALLGFLEKPIVIKKLVAYSRKQAQNIRGKYKKITRKFEGIFGLFSQDLGNSLIDVVVQKRIVRTQLYIVVAIGS